MEQTEELVAEEAIKPQEQCSPLPAAVTTQADSVAEDSGVLL